MKVENVLILELRKFGYERIGQNSDNGTDRHFFYNKKKDVLINLEITENPDYEILKEIGVK